MKNILYLVSFVFVFESCNFKNQTSKKNAEVSSSVVESKMMDNNKTRIDTFHFKGIGTEPFWSFYIHQDTFMFTQLQDKIDTTYFTLQHIEQTPTSYSLELKDEQNKMGKLEIIKQNCSDGMSDNLYTFKVTFTHNNNLLNGCGQLLN
jgi:uncharacterized membrane protein